MVWLYTISYRTIFLLFSDNDISCDHCYIFRFGGNQDKKVCGAI